MPEVTRAKEKQHMRTRMETRRLILRPFEPADVEAAFGWFGDPVVMRFTATGPEKSIEETKKRLAYFDNHQQAHGFSKWVILNAASGVAIGDSGLLRAKNSRRPFRETVQLKFFSVFLVARRKNSIIRGRLSSATCRALVCSAPAHSLSP